MKLPGDVIICNGCGRPSDSMTVFRDNVFRFPGGQQVKQDKEIHLCSAYCLLNMTDALQEGGDEK